MAGRPHHHPTKETKRIVKTLSAYGIPYDAIAEYLGIGEKVLVRHYPLELRNGRIDANARVAKSLYQLAIDGNPSACMFWLKTRAGWRERDREPGDADSPIHVVIRDFPVDGGKKVEHDKG
jgi:hypothetical protein